MEQNEQLKGLINFVGEIANQPGNEWLWDELYLLLDSQSNFNIIDNHPKLKLIYEQNVLEVAKVNAESFYLNFSIPELSDQLKTDFIKMEQARSVGDYRLFSVHCYQQLELIVNHIHDNIIKPKWPIYKDKFTEFENQSEKYPPRKLEKFIFPKKDTESAEDNSTEIKWSARKKFEIVNYLVVAMKKNSFLQTEGIRFFDELYSLRNWGAHRGNNPKEYEKVHIEKLELNPTFVVAKMIYKLSEFVEYLKKKNE
jgi:hypothetical protein